MTDRPHNLTGRIASWPFCKACGLVAMRNPASLAAARAACPGPRDQRLSGEAAARLWAKLRREGWS